MARYSKPIGRAGNRALDSSLYKRLGFLLTCCDGDGVDCKGAQNDIGMSSFWSCVFWAARARGCGNINCSWSGQEQFLGSLSLPSGCCHLQSQQWDLLAQELLNLGSLLSLTGQTSEPKPPAPSSQKTETNMVRPVGGKSLQDSTKGLSPKRGQICHCTGRCHSSTAYAF